MALPEMLAALPVEHGPLYFTFMRSWTRLAGESDLALRWPSLLAGVVAVPLLFVLGRRLVGPRAGWIAALLATTSPFLVSYGQEARMYALLLALAAGAFVAATGGRTVRRAEAANANGRGQGAHVRQATSGKHEHDDESRGIGPWIACGLLMALSVYTHYYGTLAVAALGAWAAHDLLASARQGPAGTWHGVLRGWAIAFATAGLLFAPWLPRALRVLDHPGWRETAELARAPWRLAAAWSAQTNVTAMRPTTAIETAATGLVAGLVVVGLWALLRRRAWRPLLLATVPATLAALLLLRNPDFHPRYYFAVLPAWLLLVAAGTEAVGRAAARGLGVGRRDEDVSSAGRSSGRSRRATVGTSVLAFLLLIAALPSLARHYADPSARKQDYRALIARVEAQAPPAESVLLLDGPSMGLAKRYLSAESELKLENLRSGTNRERLAEGGQEALDERLAELAERRPHVWLASDGTREEAADAWLAGTLYYAGREGVQDITLARFYAPITASEVLILAEHTDFIMVPGHPSYATAVYLSPPLDLDTARPAFAGDTLPIRLVWHTGQGWMGSPPATHPHRISLRLIDEDERVALADDRDPVGGSRPSIAWPQGDRIIDRHAIRLPESLLAGRYLLTALLYDAESLSPHASWDIASIQVIAPELDE